MFGRHQLFLLSVHRLKQQIPQVQTDCSFEWCQGKTTQIQLNAVYSLHQPQLFFVDQEQNFMYIEKNIRRLR